MTRKKWLASGIVIAAAVIVTIAISSVAPSKTDTKAKTDQPKTYPAATRVDIHFSEDGIEQKTVKIKLNTAVTWINDDDKPHHLITTVPKRPNGFESDNIPPTQRYTFVFHAKGTYHYHAQDDPTDENSGTILVE